MRVWKNRTVRGLVSVVSRTCWRPHLRLNMLFRIHSECTSHSKWCGHHRDRRHHHHHQNRFAPESLWHRFQYSRLADAVAEIRTASAHASMTCERTTHTHSPELVNMRNSVCVEHDHNLRIKWCCWRVLRIRCCCGHSLQISAAAVNRAVANQPFIHVRTINHIPSAQRERDV